MQLNTCNTCDLGQQSHSESELPPFCQACPSPNQHRDCPVRSVSPQSPRHRQPCTVSHRNPALHSPAVSQREGELGGAAHLLHQAACCTELAEQVQHSRWVHNRAALGQQEEKNLLTSGSYCQDRRGDVGRSLGEKALHNTRDRRQRRI